MKSSKDEAKKQCKRKTETVVSDEPEFKRKRVKEVPIGAEYINSSEPTLPVENQIDNRDSNLTTLNTVDEDSNENDDGNVLIVSETKTASGVQEPILTFYTRVIANDSDEEKSTVAEKECEVSTNQEVHEAVVETPKKNHEAKAKEPSTFSLNFVRKFRKNFDKMTRNNLEEFVSQKCAEVIVRKSDYADMRNKIEKQESEWRLYKTKYQELQRKYRDLEIIHHRVVKDLETNNQRFMKPAEIVRSVGLQVNLIEKLAPLTITIPTTNSALAAKNRQKILTGSFSHKTPAPTVAQSPASITETFKSPPVQIQTLHENQLVTTRKIVRVSNRRQPYATLDTAPCFRQIIPLRPIIRVHMIDSDIVITLTKDVCTDTHAEVASYQIYTHQDSYTLPPPPEKWEHVDNVKAIPLPMVVTLTRRQKGLYYFVVRAVDVHNRYSVFSLPKTWP